MIPLTKHEDITRRQLEIPERQWHDPLCTPDDYRRNAHWLELEAERGYPDAATTLEYAANQYALANHMEENPEYYAKRPENRTNWQWLKAFKDGHDRHAL